MTWRQEQGAAQLMAERHEQRPTGTWLTHEIVYTYQAIDPANNLFGALKTKQEREKKTGGWSDYRCTGYGYAHNTSLWLINRPVREVVETPTCAGSAAAETLYRYEGSTTPNDMTPQSDRLTYVLRWVDSDTQDNKRYVVEQRGYTPAGLPATIITYSATIVGLQSYPAAGQERSRTTMEYDAGSLGAPTKITMTGAGVAVAEVQKLTYDTVFPWLVAKSEDSNGLITRYAYDGFGRLSQVAAPGDALAGGEATVTYAYHDSGNNVLLQPLAVGVLYRNKTDGSPARSAERLFYDGLGRLVQTQVAGVAVEGQAEDKDVVVSYGYDARGLEVCRTAPHTKETFDYVLGSIPTWRSTAATWRARRRRTTRWGGRSG